MKLVTEYLNQVENKLRSCEDSKTTENQPKSEWKERELPQWVDNVFILMMSNYDVMWADSMPDEYAVRLKKNLWFEHLSRFREETIMRAAKDIMIRCTTYPPRIGELVKLCEELSATNRYIEHQLEDKSHETESSPEDKQRAEEARKEIRRISREIRNAKRA